MRRSSLDRERPTERYPDRERPPQRDIRTARDARRETLTQREMHTERHPLRDERETRTEKAWRARRLKEGCMEQVDMSGKTFRPSKAAVQTKMADHVPAYEAEIKRASGH